MPEHRLPRADDNENDDDDGNDDDGDDPGDGSGVGRDDGIYKDSRIATTIPSADFCLTSRVRRGEDNCWHPSNGVISTIECCDRDSPVILDD